MSTNLSQNPFPAVIDAKRVFLRLYPTAQAQIVLGPQGPFIEVQSSYPVPQVVNGFKVVQAQG